MARIVLHIGMEKTGSSALQAFLARHRRALRLMGVRYPGARGEQQSHPEIVDAVLNNSAAEVVERLKSEAERVALTVLSAEGLSGPSPAFAEALAPLQEAMDVTVVVFLRRQDEWALSAYRQAVVSGEPGAEAGLEDWLASERTQARLDYAKMLGWWETAFGAERLRVLLYPHDLPLVPAFLKAADLPAPAALLPDRNRRVNESVGDEALLAALERLGAPPAVPSLDQPARDRLLAGLRAGNEAIRARYLPHRETLFGVR